MCFLNSRESRANKCLSTNSRIVLRGVASVSKQSEPLVVVDGVVRSYDSMGYLNPNNIQNINILKDASATSLYGSRGSHGVIIISTKNNAISKEKELLYIIDGVPVKKEHNNICKCIKK